MMSKKSRNTMLYLTVAIIAFTICIGYYYMEDYQSMDTVQAHVDGDLITFSEDSGLYDETVTVSLDKSMEVPGVARIYYTLNGDDPTVESMEYTGSIHLEKKKDFMVYPLKAVVYYGGEYSEIYEKTYVVCEDVSNELDIDIVSITSDRYNLYDYENGILVPGKTYDEDFALKGGVGYIAGNYNNREDEWIRNAHVTIFDSKGGVLIDQNSGIKVSGRVSASQKIKSLKLYANSVYDKKHDKFNINLREDYIEYTTYSFVDKYNSILLRAGGQDIDYGNIRSATVSRLVQLSGLDSGNTSRRCVVYLNGTFYGIFDMQQNYSCYNLANRFGLKNPDNIEKIKGNESDALMQAGLGVYFGKDLDDSLNREILEQYVDMDNYLTYYAVNVLWNNTDWPGNNFEMWRYVGAYESDNKYSDGRYRFLIYDVDMIYNTENSFDFFEGCKEDTFVSLMENRYLGNGSSFLNVMKSSYYRDKFVTIVSDLLNTSFRSDKILGVIQEENDKIATLRSLYYGEDYAEQTAFYVDQIVRAVQARPNKIHEDFLYYFGLNEKYNMELSLTKGICVSWNNMEVFEEEEYYNQYYQGTEVVLNQEVYPGYTFQYWLVNGEKIYESSLNITNKFIRDGNIRIQAVACVNDMPEIIVSEISAKGSADWIRITNVGGSGGNLKDYYISDDEKELMKYQLPDVFLETGNSIIIYGSKNHDSVGNYICNFSLNENETLFLSKESKCIFSIHIPIMSEFEVFGRFNDSNKWVFIDVESGNRRKKYQ